METIEFEGRLEKYKPALIAWLDTVNRARFLDNSSVQINDEDFPPTIIAYLFFGEPEKAVKFAKLMLHDNVRANMGFECLQRLLTSLDFMGERLRVNKNLHTNFAQAKAMRDILDILRKLVTGTHQKDKVIDGIETELTSLINASIESVDGLLTWISDSAAKNAAELESESETEKKGDTTRSIACGSMVKSGRMSSSGNKPNKKPEGRHEKVLDGDLRKTAFKLHPDIVGCIQGFRAGHPIIDIQHELVLLESKLTPVDVARARYALADLAISKLHENLQFVSKSILTIKAFRGFIERDILPSRLLGSKFCQVMSESESKVNYLESFSNVMCFAFPRFDELVRDNQELIDEFSEELVVLRKKENEVKTSWSSFVDELVDIKKLYSKRGRLIYKVAGKVKYESNDRTKRLKTTANWLAEKGREIKKVLVETNCFLNQEFCIATATTSNLATTVKSVENFLVKP